MKSVYVETSVVSYLTALPARDLLAAAWQRATNEWWEQRRAMYELFTSRLVVEEASQGHPEPAARRLAVLSGIPHLAMAEAADDLAAALLEEHAMPEKAIDDALHVALPYTTTSTTC